MMKIAAAFASKVKSRQPVFGSWMEIPHAMVAETLAQTGVDFLLVDGEHSPTPPHLLLDILPGADRHGAPVVYRVAWNRPEYIKAALDAGAAGVMVPMINSPEEAAAAVKAAKYPPLGARGLGAWRASNYYQEVVAYSAIADEGTQVVAQIETPEAVAAVDAIAAVPGLDVVYIGPGDLALSSGRTPGVVDDYIIDACRRVSAAAQKNGIIAGIDVRSVTNVREFVGLGLSFFTHGIDYRYLLESGQQVTKAMRAAFVTP